MTVLELLEQAKSLSAEERKELAKLLIDSSVATPPKRRLSELRGLGKEIWQDIDVEEYLNQMRDEWDEATNSRNVSNLI